VCPHCGRELIPGRPGYTPEPQAGQTPLHSAVSAQPAEPTNQGLSLLLVCLVLLVALVPFGYAMKVSIWGFAQPAAPAAPFHDVLTDDFATPPPVPTVVPTATFDGTVIRVYNRGTTPLTRVRLDLNTGYRHDAGTILAGTVYEVGVMQFTKGDGTRFNPFQMAAQRLIISSLDGGWPTVVHFR
jgi:hypothetical protein